MGGGCHMGGGKGGGRGVKGNDIQYSNNNEQVPASSKLESLPKPLVNNALYIPLN